MVCMLISKLGVSMNFFSFFILGLSVFFSTGVMAVNTDNQAAIDMELGQFKLLVGRMNNGKTEIIESRTERVFLWKAFTQKSDNFEFNKEILNQSSQVLKKLKDRALELGVKEENIKALATKAFRKINNFNAAIELYKEETSIPIQILTEKEESLKGFNSVLGFGSGYEKNNIIVFESNGGSLQISFYKDGDFQFTSLPLGIYPSLRLFTTTFRSGTSSEAPLMPINQEEFNLFHANLIANISNKFSPEFRERLKQKLEEGSSVIGIGFGSLAGKAILHFNHGSLEGQEEGMLMSQNTILNFLTSLIGLEETDPQIAALSKYMYVKPILPSVTILLSVMEVSGFEKIKWMDIPAGGGAFLYLYAPKN